MALAAAAFAAAASIGFVSPAAHKNVARVALHRNAVLPGAIGRWTAGPRKHFCQRM